MNERVKAFYEAVSADGTLQEELVTVTDDVNLEGVSEDEARMAMAEAVAAFAARHDIDLTVEDVLAADDEARAEGELSEEELETVSGGVDCGCAALGILKGCFCFIYGEHKFENTASSGFAHNRCIGGGY